MAGQIAQAIYDRRKVLGLIQQELADRAGMTQPAINRLETGTALPSSRTLFCVARALETDLVVAFDAPPRYGRLTHEDLVRGFRSLSEERWLLAVTPCVGRSDRRNPLRIPLAA